MNLRVLLCIICFGLSTHLVYGVDSPDEMLKNPKQEKRAEHIGSQLRCLVCQNESIEDSSADLARDLRKIVRQRITAGDSDQQVMQWMVDRYGNFIRLKPPISLTTILLWGMPIFALCIGCIIAFFTLNKKKSPPHPLNKDEQNHLSKLMKDL